MLWNINALVPSWFWSYKYHVFLCMKISSYTTISNQTQIQYFKLQKLSLVWSILQLTVCELMYSFLELYTWDWVNNRYFAPKFETSASLTLPLSYLYSNKHSTLCKNNQVLNIWRPQEAKALMAWIYIVLYCIYC